MNKVLEVYKGTDKDMKCYGGYQYEIGRKETDTDAIRCGNKGFHSCEAPLEVDAELFGISGYPVVKTHAYRDQ